ncbi:hypothetical protein OHB00_43990 [Streptomyces sp. NBC_00631]|uniref:hypothetical protein n=1 Tax=Streptomyces sp. NBC_00631 TaxID=2975793 RepID=UPI0030E48C12
MSPAARHGGTFLQAAKARTANADNYAMRPVRTMAVTELDLPLSMIGALGTGAAALLGGLGRQGTS